MTIVTLHLKVMPGKRWDMLKTMHGLIGPTSVQPGCLHCSFYSDTRNDDELILLEKWDTFTNLEKHIRSDEFRKIIRAMESLSEPPEINFYGIASIKGMELVEKLLAFRQYRALINASPMDNSRYLLAAQNLYEQRQYDYALPLLYQSLKFKDSGIANKLAGHILLRLRRPSEAVPFLEKAVKAFPSDVRVAYQLGGAYSLSGDQQKAREILARLEKIQPDFHGIDTLRKMIESPP
jgi:quinol monooxygenase YgiN